MDWIELESEQVPEGIERRIDGIRNAGHDVTPLVRVVAYTPDRSRRETIIPPTRLGALETSDRMAREPPEKGFRVGAGQYVVVQARVPSADGAPDMDVFVDATDFEIPTRRETSRSFRATHDTGPDPCARCGNSLDEYRSLCGDCRGDAVTTDRGSDREWLLDVPIVATIYCLVTFLWAVARDSVKEGASEGAAALSEPDIALVLWYAGFFATVGALAGLGYWDAFTASLGVLTGWFLYNGTETVWESQQNESTQARETSVTPTEDLRDVHDLPNAPAEQGRSTSTLAKTDADRELETLTE